MILVTGAAGTLGSQICRQLVARDDVVLGVDVNEIDLYRLSLEIPITPIVDSITRPELWDKLHREYDITTVINCAAVKHVLTVEQHSDWAQIVNHDAVGYMTEKPWKVVHVATDKSVNPSNKYGFTKMKGEQLALKRNASVIRLVNIHNSRGCAEEIFAKQIAEGGPVTARDKRMKRYYTTVEQAAKDTIAVADNAPPGLFMPDPRDPIALDDIIKTMIDESLIPVGPPESWGTHGIDIVYTGAKPGEKLIEDVLADNEKQEAVKWSSRISRVIRDDR